MIVPGQQFYLYISMDGDQEAHVLYDYEHLKRNKMKYEVKPDIIRLTDMPKNMYPYFSLFELETSRFTALPEFQKLKDEIAKFNEELTLWKTKDQTIRNLFATYHLYENLFARVKYIANFVLHQSEAQEHYRDVIAWFAQEQPKIRNKIPQKPTAQIKPQTSSKDKAVEMEELIQTNIIKREMKVYESMARTAHSEFFPPSQRLLEYKRKQIFSYGQKEFPLSDRRASSVSNLSKKMASTRRSSMAATRSTFKQTASSLKTLKKDELVAIKEVTPFEVNEKKEDEDNINSDNIDKELDDLEREKKVQQEEIIKDNIVEVQNQEDLGGEGEQEQLLSEEDKTEKPTIKKYVHEHSPEELLAAEEEIKDIKQSTLRRILKLKEAKIMNKLQELDVKKQMIGWANGKSKTTSQEQAKLEKMHLVNKFKDLQYNPPKTFEAKQAARKKDIPEFNMLYRSKSSHPGSIEREVEKIKLASTMKSYGRYINHINLKPVVPEQDIQGEEAKIFRATSLTCFGKQGKRQPFSAIIDKYGVDQYNEEAQENLIRIKENLAKKAISLEKNTLYNALSIIDAHRIDKLDTNQVYPPKKQMFNNPFFPKHLYMTKPKKKKK